MWQRIQLNLENHEKIDITQSTHQTVENEPVHESQKERETIVFNDIKKVIFFFKRFARENCNS